MARSVAFVIATFLACAQAATFLAKDKDIACPAPLFVADCNDAGFCVCVCKDPENCPSTAATITPEEAAAKAAEYQAWHKAGGVLAVTPELVQTADGAKLECPAP